MTKAKGGKGRRGSYPRRAQSSMAQATKQSASLLRIKTRLRTVEDEQGLMRILHDALFEDMKLLMQELGKLIPNEEE